MCELHGYQLIHLCEIDIDQHPDKCKSLISAALNATTKIYARDTNISNASHEECISFFTSNHIESISKAAPVCLKLEDDNHRVVAMMSFASTAEGCWKIVKVAFLNHHSVVGGASKLFKHFVLQYSPLQVVVSCDRRWHTGYVYNHLGFTFSHTTSPSYWYFTSKQDRLYHRIAFQKHKLHNLLETFDLSKTEWENMQENNYNRIWDCGKAVYVWRA